MRGRILRIRTHDTQFFRQPGSARQCHKGEGLAGVLRHDFLRELNRNPRWLEGGGPFFALRPIGHAQKPVTTSATDHVCQTPEHETKFIRTQVSRKGPPEYDRHQEPLKGNRRGVKERAAEKWLARPGRERRLTRTAPAPGTTTPRTNEDQNEIQGIAERLTAGEWNTV